MKMSAKGRQLLIDREGYRTKAYRDSKGIWTIGVGHTSAAGLPQVTPGLTLTREQVDEIFSRDLEKFEHYVNTAIKVDLADHEFDALLSFIHNVGPAGARSTAFNLINQGKKKEGAKALMNWSKPPEIIGRRKSEVEQFLTPYHNPTPQPRPIVPPPKVSESIMPKVEDAAAVAAVGGSAALLHYEFPWGYILTGLGVGLVVYILVKVLRMR